MFYIYETRPHKGRTLPKHKWRFPYAGVQCMPGGEVVGMCPSGIPTDILEQLLNNGIKWFGKDQSSEHPISIFNVYEGVPYRAIRTRLGISYHGFPCISRRKDIPPAVYPELLALARQLGMEKEVKIWFQDHP